MKKYAVTGNIGSGKSTVCKIFESLGVPVYYADKEAKKFYRLPSVILSVKNLFGDDVFDDKEELISAKLAEIVFSDQDKLEQLNAIIHPLVMEDISRWASDRTTDYILYESALLYESGFYSLFDKSILVTAPIELAMKRVMGRDGYSEDEFMKRHASQWDEAKKIELADFVIVNDESQPLIPRIVDLHRQLAAG